MDKMLEKLMEQEARLVKEQQSHLHEGKIKLSPQIDIEQSLKEGYITADDYEKNISNIWFYTQMKLKIFSINYTFMNSHIEMI